MYEDPAPGDTRACNRRKGRAGARPFLANWFLTLTERQEVDVEDEVVEVEDVVVLDEEELDVVILQDAPFHVLCSPRWLSALKTQ